MLSKKDRQAAAKALLKAEDTRKIIPQISKTWPKMELEDAYDIQRLWAEERVKRGARVMGHKIGLTSRAMQMASKMTEPDYGVLLDDMFYDPAKAIPAEKFLSPRIEVEIGFHLGKTLEGDNISVFDVLDATDYVIPALEIIDYRTDVPRAITDTVGDNAAAAGVIMGGRPVKPMDVDLRWIGATLSKNGIIEESGVSAAVLGHPAQALVWLAQRLGRHGVKLEAGHFVLSGSFTRPTGIAAGDIITADYGPLGSISVAFS